MTMARRKVTSHETRETLNRAEARADARLDAPRKMPTRGLLPSVAELRELRDIMSSDELLRLARSAARVALQGKMYSPDDRADVAAAIVADVLAETQGCPPRRGSRRATLERLVGDAKNHRRSIDAARARDRADAEARAAAEALTPGALGISPTPADAARIVARSSVAEARRVASAICRDLQLPEDSPAWPVFYQWSRGATGEVCAAEIGVSWASWKMRQSRGAKFVRGFYGATELVARLTLGAADTVTVCDAEPDESTVIGGSGKVYAHPLYWGDVETLPAEVLTIVREDYSREAHGHTPFLADAPNAPHWREPHYARPADAAEARRACKVSRIKVRPKRERERAKGDRLAARAAALGRLAAIGAREARRERPTARTSALEHLSHAA